MDEFEQFLKQQPMRRVPPEWRRELLAARAQPWKWKPLLFRVLASAAAAAAIAAIVCRHAVVMETAPPVTVVSAKLRAVDDVSCILAAKQVGVYRAPGGQAYRVLQCMGVRRRVWEDPENGSRIEQDLPVQRVLLVSMNTY